MKLNERSNSRRQLLKWFAASPLFAFPGLAGLAAQTSTRVPQVRPDPMIWAPGDLQDLIATPEGYRSLAELRRDAGDQKGEHVALERCRALAGKSSELSCGNVARG